MRAASTALHYLNYLGIIVGGAFTFTHTSPEKQQIFQQNAALHFCFFANNYCLAFLKI